MDAGGRPHLVAIQRGTPTIDDNGQEVISWATYHEAWAKILYGTGAERRQVAQERGLQPATFMFDWSPTLAAVPLTERLWFDDAAWDIGGKAEAGFHKEVHLTAVRSE